jgi:hypothetical protein
MTLAYFRALRDPEPEAAAKDLTALLRDAGVVAPPPSAQPLAALALAPAETAPADGRPRPTGQATASLFEQAMSDLRERDPERFAARVRELGYLVNVWMAGGAHEGRRPRPMEALETVLATCEAGMRAQLAATESAPEQALALLARTPADTLFRRGFPETGGRNR